jgi:very-short-patch-repair endonuclease
MTDAEKKLWSYIKRNQLKGHRFYRQKIIGNFIVDFYCPTLNLVIELDGGQHYSQKGIIKDQERDNYLQGLNLRILRFSDRDIFENINGVIERINDYL